MGFRPAMPEIGFAGFFLFAGEYVRRQSLFADALVEGSRN